MNRKRPFSFSAGSATSLSLVTRGLRGSGMSRMRGKGAGRAALWLGAWLVFACWSGLEVHRAWMWAEELVVISVSLQLVSSALLQRGETKGKESQKNIDSTEQPTVCEGNHTGTSLFGSLLLWLLLWR